MDRAESDRNVKINIEHLSLLAFVVDVVEGDRLLVEFKEMNFICDRDLQLAVVLLVLVLVAQPDARLSKVVCKRELRIPVEANILGVLVHHLLLALKVAHCSSLSVLDLLEE